MDDLRSLKDYVTRHPNDAEAWISYASALLDNGSLEAAQTALRQVQPLNPRTPDIWVEIGKLLERMNSPQSAANAYRQATRLDPKMLEGHTSLGRLLLRAGDARAAALTMQAALSKLPESAPLRLCLADALVQSNRHKEAIPHARQAAILAPDNSQAFRLLAKIYDKLNEQALCIKALKQVAELDPDDDVAAAELGHKLATAGEKEEARARLMKLSNNLELPHEVLLSVGRGLLEADAPTQAVQVLQGAARQAPDHVEGQIALGLAQETTGDLPAAVSSLRAAVALAPDSGQPHYHLGMALWRAGETNEAASVLVKASANEPHDESIRTALAKVLSELSAPPQVTQPSGGFSGDLSMFSLPELLEFLSNQRSTGVLHLSSGLGQGDITLYKGRLVCARAPSDQPLLARLLAQKLETETRAQLNQLTPLNEPLRDLLIASEVLKQALLEPEVLLKAHRGQLISALTTLLSWKKGRAEFRARELEQAAQQTHLQQDTRFILLETFRLLDEGVTL